MTDPPSTRQRRFILVAQMMTMMLAVMDTTIASTVIPEVVEDLGGFALFGWVFAIYGKRVIFLTGAVASSLAWNRGQRLSPRRRPRLGPRARASSPAGDAEVVG